MSLADSSIIATAGAWDSVHVDVWQILSGNLAGQNFRGEAQVESPMILSTELGSDAREKTRLFCWRPAPALTLNTKIYGKGHSWTVVDRIDNPANTRVEFEILKLESIDT